MTNGFSGKSGGGSGSSYSTTNSYISGTSTGYGNATVYNGISGAASNGGYGTYGQAQTSTSYGSSGVTNNMAFQQMAPQAYSGVTPQYYGQALPPNSIPPPPPPPGQ